jgi:hypothetical protein
MNKLNKYIYNGRHKFNKNDNKIHDAIYQYHYNLNKTYSLLKRHINKNLFGIHLSKYNFK